MRMLAFGQSQPLLASGPPVVTTCAHARCRNVRKPGPVRCPRSCPASTMDATIGQPSDTAGRSIRPDTVHSTRHAMANRKRRGQGTDERHGRCSDILDRHDHKAAHRDTPSPLLWGWRLRLGNQGWLGDGQDCQRDRNHGSDQAATWCRSAVQAAPRRTAVLGRFRVERRASGEASSVMASSRERVVQALVLRSVS